MAERSRSAKRFLERHGLRPVGPGPLRLGVFSGQDGVHALALDDTQKVPSEDQALGVADPVDTGSARPWPFGA